MRLLRQRMLAGCRGFDLNQRELQRFFCTGMVIERQADLPGQEMALTETERWRIVRPNSLRDLERLLTVRFGKQP